MLLDDLFLKLPIEIGIQDERLTDDTGVYIFLDKEDNVLFNFFAYRCENYPPPEDEAKEVLKKWVNHPDVISYYEPVEGLYYSELENERFMTIDYFIDNIYYEQTDNNSKESTYTKKLFPKSYFMDILKRELSYESVKDIHKQLEREKEIIYKPTNIFEQVNKLREERQKLEKEKGKDRGFGLGR